MKNVLQQKTICGRNCAYDKSTERLFSFAKGAGNVFLIVIYEKSPKEFHELSDIYFHHSKQIIDSGLKFKLLQEFVMIPLDIYKRKMQNESVTTKFDAWLTFLSEDSLEKIISLMEKYPEFKLMYETLYQICQNTERVVVRIFTFSTPNKVYGINARRTEKSTSGK